MSCPNDCGGCSCHIRPPCGHCTEHFEEPGSVVAKETSAERATELDLGWINSWKTTPLEWTRCVDLKHDRTDIDVGRPPHRGLEHVVRCGICKIVARYDSSD